MCVYIYIYIYIYIYTHTYSRSKKPYDSGHQKYESGKWLELQAYDCAGASVSSTRYEAYVCATHSYVEQCHT